MNPDQDDLRGANSGQEGRVDTPFGLLSRLILDKGDNLRIREFSFLLALLLVFGILLYDNNLGRLQTYSSGIRSLYKIIASGAIFGFVGLLYLSLSDHRFKFNWNLLCRLGLFGLLLISSLKYGVPIFKSQFATDSRSGLHDASWKESVRVLSEMHYQADVSKARQRLAEVEQTPKSSVHTEVARQEMVMRAKVIYSQDISEAMLEKSEREANL
ncbi:MAG: hypothetical protein WCK51_03390 [Armatimonadota bacterium]